MTDTVVSASVAANDANVIKSKLAKAEADLENALTYIETLFTANHVGAAFLVGLVAGIIVRSFI